MSGARGDPYTELVTRCDMYHKGTMLTCVSKYQKIIQFLFIYASLYGYEDHERRIKVFFQGTLEGIIENDF